MNAPRLEINIEKIESNAHILVNRLTALGISVTGVMKVMQGSPKIAKALMRAGVSSLGDSHIENIELMNNANIHTSMRLIRTPMITQVDRVILSGAISFNTELIVIQKLSEAAQRLAINHEIILMVELGDLREGIMPEDIEYMVAQILTLPNIFIKGLGANLGCLNGISPDSKNMNELSLLTNRIENKFNLSLDIITGGNSANINWVFKTNNTGRINNLRLGESIFLGTEPLCNSPIDGLELDAIKFVAEVVESKSKPTATHGSKGLTCFKKPDNVFNNKFIYQSILAVGHQDTDPSGLECVENHKIIGATSDHLIIGSTKAIIPIGTEIVFQLNYSALLKSMISPFVEKVII